MQESFIERNPWLIIFATIFLALFSSVNGMSQAIPQIRMQTSTYTPSTFTPIPYTPQTADRSILYRSMEKREARRREANEAYQNLTKECNMVSDKLGSAHRAWIQHYTDSVCGRVRNLIEIGETSTATEVAYEAINDLRLNQGIHYRIDSYSDYVRRINEMQENYTNGNVYPETYNIWLSKNQYTFIPKYDSKGSIVGYKPCVVSYLHKDINWDEFRQYVRSEGVDNVNKMWYLYFLDSEHKASLQQFYDTAVAKLRVYENNLKKPSLSQEERSKIASSVELIKNFLYDSNHKPSMEIMIENIRNSMKQ